MRICPDCEEELEEHEAGPKCDICWENEIDYYNDAWIDDEYGWEEDDE